MNTKLKTIFDVHLIIILIIFFNIGFIIKYYLINIFKPIHNNLLYL